MGRGSSDREARRTRHLTFLTEKVADQEALLELYREQDRCKNQAIKNLEKINKAQREIIAALERQLESFERSDD